MQKSINEISQIIWNNFKYKNILFAVSSLWLWHATRTLNIIKYYLDLNLNVSIISYWNALIFLKEELRNYKNINFIELKDYPAIERWIWIGFYYYIVLDILNITRIIKYENKFVKSLDENFDFIFSDWRYWIYKKNTPSYLLSHQISFIMPNYLWVFQKLMDYSNYNYFKKFDTIFIPDYKEEKKSLAWKLSHSGILEKIKHFYIWPISSYNQGEKIKKDIDFYFIISWYLHDYKESFINKLIEQSKELKWKKVFVLWNALKNDIKELKEFNITIYSHVSSKERLDFFYRAKYIISMAWYSTIMDLVLNNKKALLFPTKNQTEQEYLAKYLWEKWLFINWWQTDFNLKKLISKID